MGGCQETASSHSHLEYPRKFLVLSFVRCFFVRCAQIAQNWKNINKAYETRTAPSLGNDIWSFQRWSCGLHCEPAESGMPFP